MAHRLSWTFLLLHLLLVSVATATTSAPFHEGENMPSNIYHNMTLHGDGTIEDGKISLTCARSHCLGVGRALYSNPVRLREPGTNRALSFSSNFTFYMTPLDVGTFGDGLAFLMTSDLSHVGSSHGYMGIYYNEHKHAKQHASPSGISTVAVEFDTSHNNGDINGNHVALDVGNISSVASADAGGAGVDMKSGYKMRAWVEYNGDIQELQVWLSYRRERPLVPLLKTKVNLSGLLHDNMFVGFSASNGKGATVHVVEEWKFKTSLLATKSPSRKRWLVLGLGLGIGLAAVLIVMGTGFLVCRRRRRDGSEHPEKPVADLPV